MTPPPLDPRPGSHAVLHIASCTFPGWPSVDCGSPLPDLTLAPWASPLHDSARWTQSAGPRDRCVSCFLSPPPSHQDLGFKVLRRLPGPGNRVSSIKPGPQAQVLADPSPAPPLTPSSPSPSYSSHLLLSEDVELLPSGMHPSVCLLKTPFSKLLLWPSQPRSLIRDPSVTQGLRRPSPGTPPSLH